MGSVKPTKSKPGKGSSKSSSAASKKSSKPTGSAPEGISKRKQKSLALAKPGGAQKSKSISSTNSHKPKRRKYTEKELDIPALNGIVPAGIAKPKGQKKGKVFVDDAQSMMAIMSVVNAEKDRNVESKIMRARQLEEVREAKRVEAEKRGEEKKAKFEETKKGLKKKRKGRHSDHTQFDIDEDEPVKEKKVQGKKKRVSFG
ncbi:hypothetical protein CC80DRAFT_495639 [Byssothecium circinans]|uniref:60S ribosomal subunit assembly/export protein LOC1 n=1 Tax=Byssothecium circinans TaxID=147558 RepID=A0A6A5TGS8_9PLEO|nr:hypothetical protein CC80DRAFT_495639 [Byssothecium circinans]